MAYKDVRRYSEYMSFFWNVSQPVGPSMSNAKHDAALVQVLLRLCYDTGWVTSLAMDGVCGPKTREAIRKFQMEFSGYSVKDGKLPLEIDGIVSHAENFGFDSPGGKVTAYTIVALNYVAMKHQKVAWENLAYNPSVPVFLRLHLLKATA